MDQPDANVAATSAGFAGLYNRRPLVATFVLLAASAALWWLMYRSSGVWAIALSAVAIWMSAFAIKTSGRLVDGMLFQRWWVSADQLAELVAEVGEVDMPEVFFVGTHVAISNPDGDDADPAAFCHVEVNDRRWWVPYKLDHKVFVSNDGYEKLVQTVTSVCFHEITMMDGDSFTTITRDGVQVEMWGEDSD